MARRIVPSVVAFLFGCAIVLTAQAPPSAFGTWKQNIAKSTYVPGPAPKSQTVRQEAVPGGGMKVVVDGIDAEGKPTHSEIVTMFNGKETPYSGTELPTTRAYVRIDDHTYQYTTRVNGRVMTTTRVVTSADGKTRTNTTTGMDTMGRVVKNVTVWERQ